MKVRTTDFVTNSSRSSFVCVAKIDKSSKLLDYFKEEYGKYGLRLLDENLVTGKEIKENKGYDYKEFKVFCNNEGIELSDTDMYLQAIFTIYTEDGTECDDEWLYNHIPNEFKEEIYEGRIY